MVVSIDWGGIEKAKHASLPGCSVSTGGASERSGIQGGPGQPGEATIIRCKAGRWRSCMGPASTAIEIWPAV
jgi:hypothetical protein